MKLKLQKILYLIGLLVFSFCASPQVDTLYYSEVADYSDIPLDKYKNDSEGIALDHNGWNTTITQVFQKLAPDSKVVITIVKKNTFNMVFFPENNFIIHTGALDILDKELSKMKSDVPSLRNCVDINSCREMMLAPIVGHELAHFLQEDHKILKLKLAEYSSLSQADRSERILLFKREREFAADSFSTSLLSTKNYKPELALIPIYILKKIDQSRNKNPNDRIDYYLKSHPSPNERLANLDKKESFQNLKELEKAFHLVASGKNENTLKYALKLIEVQLQKFPENLELKRARATAMHRYWMYTANPSDLKYVAIIDQPLFSDSEEFNTTKGFKKIPGDEMVYKKALELYEDLYYKLRQIDIGFISNYAVLLAYSDSEDNKKKSLSLALDAFQNKKSFKTLNNLGVVYALNNEFINGMKSFWSEISESDRKSIESNQLGKSIPMHSMEEISFPYNESYIKNEKELKNKVRTISLFNFTLIKFYSGRKEDQLDANYLRRKYFYAGDEPSPWVQHLHNDFAHSQEYP